MPITFKVAAHDANPLRSYDKSVKLSAEEVLKRGWDSTEASCKEMLQSSLDPKPEFSASKNGFVWTAIRAYNEHHNLILRPEDIWIAILSQLNLYVNAHAEELRTKFVAHEGKKELTIVAAGTRYTVNFGKLAEQMGELIKENIVDPSLHEWILPSFTTTTPNDTVVCSIMMMSTLKAYFSYGMMMSTLKAYFSYGMMLMCGLPSVTLLGEKHDYEDILQRIDKLEEFGEEPTAFALLLRPILTQFILAFNVVAQGGTPDSEFWGKICHKHSGGSGPTYISGWLTAFTCWNQDGKWQGPELDTITQPVKDAGGWGPLPLVYEGLRYPVVDMKRIPPASCEVDVKLNDNGAEFECMMVAGHVGSVASGKDDVLDSLQPASEWFMFIKGGAPTRSRSAYW